jgi:hypothetical protein
MGRASIRIEIANVEDNAIDTARQHFRDERVRNGLNDWVGNTY